MNLAGWSFHFGTEISLDAGRMVGRFRFDGRTAYMAAVADGSWRETLDLIAADADRQNAPLLLMGVCRHVVPHIEAAHPGRFRFTPVRNLFDYVYRREDLADAGRTKPFYDPDRPWEFEHTINISQEINDLVSFDITWHYGRFMLNSYYDTKSQYVTIGARLDFDGTVTLYDSARD